MRKPGLGRSALQVVRCSWLFVGLIAFFLAVFPSIFEESYASAAVTFQWATVGNAGNAGDTFVGDKGRLAGSSGFGAVDYEFQIAKEHVTNAQYAEFLNAVDPTGSQPNGSDGIYNANMSLSTIGSNGLSYTGGIDFDGNASDGGKYTVKNGQANYPAAWINWVSGARFVNWLSNGQGAGDTENGVYDMSVSFGADTFPTRQAGATVFLPSEDEFYKAAYYDPAKNDGAGGYWKYGVQSDAEPISEAPSGGATSANYASTEETFYWQTGSQPAFNDSIDYLTDVGAYADATSHYGVHDVDGLIYQWTEATELVSTFQGPFHLPVYRGGAWYFDQDHVGAGYRNYDSFARVDSYAWFGLRVASLATGIDGDFDDSGSYACADIDALVLAIAAGTNDAAFDLTGDGFVTLADRDAWLAEGGAAELASGNPFLIGDTDLSGGVDSTDLGLLLNNFGATNGVSYCGGDLDGDSNVNSTDLGLLLNNFGSEALRAAAVPEPSAMTLSMLALAALGVMRRRSW